MSQDFVEIVKKQTQAYEQQKKHNSGTNSTTKKNVEEKVKPNKPGQGLDLGAIRGSNLQTVTTSSFKAEMNSLENPKPPSTDKSKKVLGGMSNYIEDEGNESIRQQEMLLKQFPNFAHEE